MRDAFPPCKARGEVLEYLCAKEQENETLGWSAIATGCHLENGLTSGLLGFDLTWESAAVYGRGDERFPCSTLGGNGEAVLKVLEALQDGAGVDGFLYRPEFMATQNEILAALENVQGKKWDVVKAEVDECVREGGRRMEKGFFDGAMMLLERNVLFGEVGNVDVWTNRRPRGLGENGGRLGDVVKTVVAGLERDGRADCGCG